MRTDPESTARVNSRPRANIRNDLIAVPPSPKCLTLGSALK
jgi:hypothetical protein